MNIINVTKSITDITNVIKSISFSGGGYNCIYHLGVIKYIFEFPDFFKNYHYLGASGGASLGALILSYENDSNRLNIIDKLVDEFINTYDNKKIVIDDYIKLITKYVTKENFNKYVSNSNRCYVSITKMKYSIIPLNKIINSFCSYEDYLDHISASASIPFVFDNKIRKIGDDTCVDGGFTNNNPVLNDSTIVISCIGVINIFNKPHIYPKEIFKLKHSIISPDKVYLKSMFIAGYLDMKEYFDKLIK